MCVNLNVVHVKEIKKESNTYAATERASERETLIYKNAVCNDQRSEWEELFKIKWNNRQQMANDIKKNVEKRVENKNYFMFFIRFYSFLYRLFSFALPLLSLIIVVVVVVNFFFALPCFCFMCLCVYTNNKPATYNYSSSNHWMVCLHICIYVWFPKNTMHVYVSVCVSEASVWADVSLSVCVFINIKTHCASVRTHDDYANVAFRIATI